MQQQHRIQFPTAWEAEAEDILTDGNACYR